jgi:hypothetical protein
MQRGEERGIPQFCELSMPLGEERGKVPRRASPEPLFFLSYRVHFVLKARSLFLIDE